MAISFTFIDDLIRDYFQYRNLTTTSRLFDHESCKLPLGEYRADRIIEQLTLYIHQFEINSLIDYWTQIEQRLLSTLEINSQQLNHVFSKIRLNLYRCYLIHAVQSSKMEKINEFYDRLSKVLQQSNDWTKEWFALPFIKNPEENITFQVYFSKQWNELFRISLQNFLSTAFVHAASPLICSIENEDSDQYKSVISSATRVNPSDNLQTSEQQHKSNLTIMSKLQNQFAEKNKYQLSSSPKSLVPHQSLHESATEEFRIQPNA